MAQERISRMFLLVPLSLLLVGMSVVIWSGVEMYRLDSLNRGCDNQIRIYRSFSGLTAEAPEGCPYVEDYPFYSLQRFGLVLGSVGGVALAALVFFRFRTPLKLPTSK